MNKIFIILSILLFTTVGCDDFLDVVPDNVATIDHAFKDRTTTQRYLATCYRHMPTLGHPTGDPALLGSDEWWAVEDAYYGTWYGLRLRKGLQNSNSPLMNCWDGANQAKDMFQALRDCNVFLENINKVSGDLSEQEKSEWIAEVKFLKAYYHFYLLRAYGPIPLQKKNLPVAVGIDESRVERDLFDDCVNYIVELLDEAAADLPLAIQSKSTDLGHITKPAALTLKTDVLLTAASPLFNGNDDFSGLTNSLGESLFSSYDQEKWTRAANAGKEALEASLAAGHMFFKFDDYRDISDTTQLLMNLKQVVSERWNDEIIWTMSHLNMYNYYRAATGYFFRDQQQWVPTDPFMAPTLRTVERFYSSNGVPISEDNTYDYDNRYNVGVVPDDHIYYAKPGYKTMNLHLNREPRFYANIVFDGGVWFGNGRYKEIGDGAADETSWIFDMKAGAQNGKNSSFRYSVSGYWAKKPSHIENNSPVQGTHSIERPTYPLYRLADLYLMYAEALNESLESPSQEVYDAIDQVRHRAGLEGVVDSWTNFSKYPEKVKNKAGMREIIRTERSNELVFESKHFWDVRRWKTAHIDLNEPIKGLNANGATTEDFNNITVLYQQTFSSKEYLWPISIYNLQVNTKLQQNPGW